MPGRGEGEEGTCLGLVMTLRKEEEERRDLSRSRYDSQRREEEKGPV